MNIILISKYLKCVIPQVFFHCKIHIIVIILFAESTDLYTCTLHYIICLIYFVYFGFNYNEFNRRWQHQTFIKIYFSNAVILNPSFHWPFQDFSWPLPRRSWQCVMRMRVQTVWIRLLINGGDPFLFLNILIYIFSKFTSRN